MGALEFHFRIDFELVPVTGRVFAKPNGQQKRSGDL
jgi:hypothetical protein